MLNHQAVESNLLRVKDDFPALAEKIRRAGALVVGGYSPYRGVCGFGQTCPMNALPWIFGADTQVTPEKFCRVEAQTDTWEQAQAFGLEIARRLAAQLRM